MACYECQQHGVWFDRPYDPIDFIEGYRNSPIWIIGLNPAGEAGSNDGRTIDQLINWLQDPANRHQYFGVFQSVSEQLFNELGHDNGVAHTDLVKCYSRRWNLNQEVVNNCAHYLVQQLAAHQPRVLVCNGADTSRLVQSQIQPVDWIHPFTSYRAVLGGQNIWVVLSGFLGQTDNWAKRRLGREITEIAQLAGVWQ